MLKRLLSLNQTIQHKNVFKFVFPNQNFNFSASNGAQKPTTQPKTSPKAIETQDSLKFLRKNLRTRFNLSRDGKIKLIESVKFIDFRKDKISLPEIKAVFQVLEKDWLANKNIQEAIKNIEDNFDLLLSTTKDLLDIENLLNPYQVGLIYIDESKKVKIFHRLMSILNTQRKSLGLVSRIFSSLANLTNLSAGEVELFAELVVELGKRSPGEDGFEKALIFAINSILIQKRYENQHLLELLELLEERNLSDPKIKNLIIFNMEHLKVFLAKDQLIEKCIKSIYLKLGSTNYERNIAAVDSNTQAKIAKIMVDEGYLVHENKEIGIYSIDFLLKPKLVIEYHGFSHYYTNKQEIIKLHQMKIDYLKDLGYYVQIIPHYEWHGLEKHENQVNYLNEAIYQQLPNLQRD